MKDKQRRDPTVGSNKRRCIKLTKQSTKRRSRSGSQETGGDPTVGSIKGGESDSPGRKPSGNPIIGSVGLQQVQVDSREKKLSRVKAGTEISAQGTKYSDKSAWRICQSDPKIPPADKTVRSSDTRKQEEVPTPVSYTHLTLPTKRIV